jgi:hypothetical protein
MMEPGGVEVGDTAGYRANAATCEPSAAAQGD